MNSDLVCLSHLRWDSVYQRPHHLMSRFARTRRVFFVEEPERASDVPTPRLRVRRDESSDVVVVTPRLPQRADEGDAVRVQRRLFELLVEEHEVWEPVLWYYTPMAMEFTHHLRSSAVVYDCMDELSAFRDAPPRLLENERRLFTLADLVFAGGESLYESKRSQHSSVHLFPSSVDRAHFGRARQPQGDPDDQAEIPHPRIGYFGVLDERLDLDLLRHVADARPDWHLVMVGPVAKIDPTDLPARDNIHHLGPKSYSCLPRYLSGWSVALLPFASNEATRFISPTKTPEYLAAGCPVVSTPIRDVVRPYGDLGLVRIAEDRTAFVSAVEAALDGESQDHWKRVDRHLSGMSWDNTWAQMDGLIRRATVESNRKIVQEAVSV